MEKCEDLKLPISVVTRVIKGALPDGVAVSKEARTAIARAASVFVLHATNFANEHAHTHKRKTIGANDIIAGLVDLDCEGLVETVKKELIKFREEQAQKKLAKSAKRPRIEDENGVAVDSAAVDDEVVELDDDADETLPETMAPIHDDDGVPNMMETDMATNDIVVRPPSVGDEVIDNENDPPATNSENVE